MALSLYEPVQITTVVQLPVLSFHFSFCPRPVRPLAFFFTFFFTEFFCELPCTIAFFSSSLEERLVRAPPPTLSSAKPACTLPQYLSGLMLSSLLFRLLFSTRLCFRLFFLPARGGGLHLFLFSPSIPSAS